MLLEINEMRDLIRQAIKQSGLTQEKWCEAVGISRQFLQAVLSGAKTPSKKICLAIGWQRVLLFEPLNRSEGSENG